jgi:hypothetical protein
VRRSALIVAINCCGLGQVASRRFVVAGPRERCTSDRFVAEQPVFASAGVVVPSPPLRVDGGVGQVITNHTGVLAQHRGEQVGAVDVHRNERILTVATKASGAHFERRAIVPAPQREVAGSTSYGRIIPTLSASCPTPRTCRSSSPISTLTDPRARHATISTDELARVTRQHARRVANAPDL